MTEFQAPAVPYCPVWAPDDEPGLLTDQPFACRAGRHHGTSWRCVGMAYLEPSGVLGQAAFRLALQHQAAPGLYALRGGEFVARHRGTARPPRAS